jgi:Cu(I)/Ag(I) efflux system membrane protein CusA/SilA
MQLPGVTNAWTMPIKARIDMLSTGIRTPVGIKIFGPDLNVIEAAGLQVEDAIKNIRGTRSVFAERTAGGYFIDCKINREALARYGLTVSEVQMTINSAIGGESISTTVEGRERYTINVRYGRELRDDISKLKKTLIVAESGALIPLEQAADIYVAYGPSMIKDENGMLTGYVYVDVAGRDIGSYIREAKAAVAENVVLEQGYTLQWSGQYENMVRVKKRLTVIIPLTIFIIFLLLYMNTKSTIKALIVLLAVPFSLIGAVWFLYILGYNVSIAVWVGMIALMGLDAETGVFMLLYLDLSFNEAIQQGKMRDKADLNDAIVHGAVKRIRPKMMTVAAMFMGLIPIMFATGAGADVMKRIAAPMIGGIFTSFILELLVYPPVYALLKKKELKP